MRRVAVTGLGLVSPYGYGTAAFNDGLFAGHSALGSLTIFSADGRVDRYAGQIEAPCEGERPAERAERFAGEAIREALLNAGFGAGWPANARVAGVAAAFAGPAALEERELAQCGWPTDVGTSLQKLLPKDSPLLRVTTACASVGTALEIAALLIGTDQLDMVLIAGSEVLNMYSYTSLKIAGAISSSIVRPFDIKRDGTVLGEGAGALVLESEASLSARGTCPLAWLTGTSSVVGGKRPRSLEVHPETATRCIGTALERAGDVEIGYVHAHATATQQGDRSECEAILRVLPNAAYVPVSSHKGATGHLLQCAGFLAVAAGLEALRRGVAPPTVGLTEPDPSCAVRQVVGVADDLIGPAVLVDMFGFGGNYAAAVLEREVEG